MRLAQLGAILWMRWRMLKNLVKRRGKLGNTLFVLLSIALLLLSAGGLCGSFALGVELLPEAEPVHLLLVWTALTAALVFSWSIGVVTELQRSDAISIHSLLHLPASMLGVHLYNYLSSFVSVSLLIFMPPMIGLASASVWVFGARMLPTFALVAGMIGLLTALTYQLRGWLGTMIHDKRKRKNVVVLLTISFALLAQFPNLINIAINRSTKQDPAAELEREEALESTEAGAGLPELSAVEPEPGTEVEPASSASEPAEESASAHEERQARRKERRAKKMLLVDKWLSRAALVVPFGWLAYGVRALLEGSFLSSLLCILGLFAVTGLSLRRSYRTTLRFITGVDSAGERETKATPRAVSTARASSAPLFVARELPLLSEAPSVIALAGMKALWRSPEFKMVLLTPLILILVGGVALFSGDTKTVSEGIRPMLGLGAICMGLFTIMQLLQNQFGLDRDGFRAYVLSPIPRDQVLLGKNLAGAPFGLCISLVGLFALQIIFPVDALHFLGGLCLLPAGYLLTCLAANLLSILAPMRLKEGTMKADNAKAKTVLLQVLTLLCLPLLLSPLGIPSLLEMLGGFLGIGRSWPIYFITCVLVLSGTCLCYRVLLPRQGRLLQSREQRMLEILTRSAA